MTKTWLNSMELSSTTTTKKKRKERRIRRQWKKICLIFVRLYLKTLWWINITFYISLHRPHIDVSFRHFQCFVRFSNLPLILWHNTPCSVCVFVFFFCSLQFAEWTIYGYVINKIGSIYGYIVSLWKYLPFLTMILCLC